MKTKLLTLLLFLFISIFTQAQTSTTDYVSGVTDAEHLDINGTDMYVMGAQNIYSIDTTISEPTPVLIYTAPVNHFLVNFTISGNSIYVALENYIEATDTFLGGKVISLDLNNLSNSAEDIYTTSEYISAITADGTTVLITAETLVNPPAFEPFTTHLDVINTTDENPTATLLVSLVTESSVIGDIIIEDDIVYLSSRDHNEILKIDLNEDAPTIDVLSENTFSRGIFKTGDNLYVSNGSLIQKIGITTDEKTSVAVNATYKDTHDGSEFFANFRDVLIVGNTIYATLANQGLVVEAVDTTLSSNELDLKNVTIYNNDSNIYVNGLTNTKDSTIYNINGQLLVEKTIDPNNNQIDINTLPNGIYILNIENKQTFKFIK